MERELGLEPTTFSLGRGRRAVSGRNWEVLAKSFREVSATEAYLDVLPAEVLGGVHGGVHPGEGLAGAW